MYDFNKNTLPKLFKEGASKEDWEARRQEILELMQKEMYGYTPKEKCRVEAEVLEEKSEFAGKALLGRVKLTCTFGSVSFSFPVTYAFPVKNEISPVFVHINFRPLMPDQYMPAEEIIDGGFGFAQICYKDIVNDNLNGDFSDGLGLAYFNGRGRNEDDWGKVGMWAYALSRTIDYLETRKEVDKKHIMAIGHSRLGKTSLWAGAQDERIYATFVNDSGAGGSAITRDKEGEHIHHFAKSGMWDWFGERYKSWANREDEMPFDQHFAIALIAPRLVCVGSAENDTWADPKSEKLGCEIAGEVWALYGKDGLTEKCDEEFENAYLSGCVGYQVRTGDHYLSRTDWIRYMKFAKMHIETDA